MNKYLLFICLLFITTLSGCGEPFTDEMVKAVAETCKQQGMVVYVDNWNKQAYCQSVIKVNK